MTQLISNKRQSKPPSYLTDFVSVSSSLSERKRKPITECAKDAFKRRREENLPPTSNEKELISNVKWLNAAEFTDLLEELKTVHDLENKMTFIQKRFASDTDETSIYADYLDTCVKITFTVGKFFSEAFRETTLSLRPGRPYHALKIYESIRRGEVYEDKLIMKIGMSLKGKRGELCWIERGEKLSGAQVLHLYHLFADTLKIPEMFLYDDSRIIIPATVEEDEKRLSLRIFEILAKDEAISWYERNSFVLLACSRLELKFSKRSLYTQNGEKYAEAKQWIRNTHLSKFNVLLTDDQRNLLTGLQATYLQEQEGTIHDLMKAMRTKLLEVSAEEKVQVHLHIYHLIQLCLSLLKIKTPTEEQKKFIDAYAIIEGARIYVKKY